MSKYQLVQSVQRAMQITQAVAGSDNGLALNEICKLTGLKTPTAHNLVRTLVAGRFLGRDEPALCYTVGPAIAEMASRRRRRGFLDAVAEETRRIHEQYPGSVATYSEAENNDIFVRTRAWPLRPGVVERPEASLMQPYTTVTSLVFQAFWPADLLAAYRTRYPLWEYGAHLWPAQKALDRELEGVRKRGYAWALRDPATLLVAAPVFGPGQDIVGAFGLRMDDCGGDREALAEQAGSRLCQVGASVVSRDH